MSATVALGSGSGFADILGQLAGRLTEAHRQIQESYRERGAQGYDAGCDNSKWIGPGAVVTKLNERFNLAGNPEGGRLRVLDLGAGTGRIGKEVKELNPAAHVVGVDLSQDLIDGAAQKIFPGESVTRIDEGFGGVSALDFIADPALAPAKSFSVVTVAGVLDYLSEDDIGPLAQNIVRVTQDGGAFGLTFQRTNPAEGHHGPKKNRSFGVEFIRAAFEKAGACDLQFDVLPNAWHLQTKQNGARDVENVVLTGSVPHVN